MKTRTTPGAPASWRRSPRPSLAPARRRRGPRRSCRTSTRAGSTSRSKDGLPNDHIFAVRVDGPRVWVGTEDGLALIDKPTGKVVKTWQEKDGLPWKVVTAIDVDTRTGDVWLGLFGGGLARLSGGRFDHWHQLNSGLVNDVVYGVTIENDNVWAATTAGASRYNTVTGEWTVFTEKNAPMEEIWNYAVNYAGGDKVYLAVWGSGVLEYDIKTGRWKEYLDPDGEMEIDLYRDDGINHVIVTGANEVDGVVWVSSYFGALPLRRPALARLRGAGGRPAFRLQQQHPGPLEGGGALLLGQGPRHHHQRARGGGHLGGLHARPGHRPRPGEGDAGRQGRRGDRHAARRAAQLHDRGRRGRERHLDRDGQGPRLGDRRGLLPGTKERPLYAYGVPVEPERGSGRPPSFRGTPVATGPEESASPADPSSPGSIEAPGVTRRPRRRQGGKP